MPKHYRYVDSLRGLAIVAVVIVHVGFISHMSPRLSAITVYGESGVQLFYVVSALTLMLSMASRTNDSIKNFFIRRFFRIAPAFYLTTALSLLWFGWGARAWAPRGITRGTVLTTLFFLHGWRPDTINAIVPGGWSIAIEMCFYLILPALFVVIRSFRTAALVWALSVVAAFLLQPMAILIAVACGYSPGDAVVQAFQTFWFPAQLPVFIGGIALYFALKESLPLTHFIAWSFLGGSLTFAASHLMHRHYRAPLYGAIFAAVVMLLANFQVVLLVNPITEFLGKISFSAYLTHQFIISMLGDLFASFHLQSGLERFIVFFLLTISVTAALSVVLWKFVEIPFQRMGKRLIERIGSSTTAHS